MYELHLYDFGMNYVGMYRTEDYLDAKTHLRDFLQAKYTVKFYDKDGSLLEEVTVMQ
jgi:hypothetical protein